MPKFRTLVAALSLSTLLACSDESEPKKEPSPAVEDDEPQKEAQAKKPLYAVMYEVFRDDGSDSYLSLFESLDVDEVDTDSAREFAGGRAHMQAYDGHVFVSDPESPVVHRFS